MSKRVLSHAITANRPPARSRARAPFPGFDASRPKSGTLLVSKRAFSNVGRAPGGAAPADPHQWRACCARTRRHAVRHREQACDEPCDHGKSPSCAISRARSVSRLRRVTAQIGTSATRKKVARRATRDVRRARDASCDRAAPGARSTAALARAVSARLSCISPALRRPPPGTFSRRLPRCRAVRKRNKKLRNFAASNRESRVA